MNSNLEDLKNFKDEIKNSKSDIQSKTEREFISLNEEINNEKNENDYSIALAEVEEDELNSDEYISSSNLDVETNTYIDYNITNNNNEKQIINKSLTKNLKNFVKAININNKDYINQISKRGNSNSSRKSQNKNKENYANSPLYNNRNKKSKFKQKIKISDNNEKDVKNNQNKNKKEIMYKKLDIKDIQNKKRISKEKDKFNKNHKYNKNDNRDIIKNYSLLDYNSPIINNIFDENIDVKNENDNNYMDVIKKKNSGNKNMHKKIKTNPDMVKINKIVKHIRSPTLVDNNINKNRYMKEFLLKQKNTKQNEITFKKNNKFSPINNKNIINSLKSVNNTMNNEASSSIINNFINNSNINNFLVNNSLSNNARTISSNDYKINKYIVNQTINLNNFKKNFNRINNIIFSPQRKMIIGKPKHKKVNSCYANQKINSNSISIEKNYKNIINKNINKFSDRLLTYDCKDHHLLTRNKTFKNKGQINDNDKFLNLLLNKKKININKAKELLMSSNRSPRLKVKMVIDRNNKLNLKDFKNRNKSNYYLLNNNNINSTSTKRELEHYQTINKNKINNNFNKINNSKKYIYLQKHKLSNNSNKINIPLKTINVGINPFNYQSFNNNKLIKRKILSQSKSKSKCINDEKLDKKCDKKCDINMSSINPININKIAKIKKIGIKKNRQRAKTLIEEDYLRNFIINSINQERTINNTFMKGNNNISKKNNKNVNKNMSINELKNKSNFSSSVNDMIIKSPSERHNINFNININMNNNNYKKLIYHYHGYHGHNKSSGSYNFPIKTNPNSNKIEKKKLKI